MVTLGSVMLGLALVSAIVSIGALLWGNALGPKQGDSITNVGYLATFAAMAALTVAILAHGGRVLPPGLHVLLRRAEPQHRRLQPGVALQALRPVGRPRGLVPPLGVAALAVRVVGRVQAT